MDPNKTETATVFCNTTRSVFYCSHAPQIIWDLQDTTSLALAFCRCRVYNLATCSSFKCTYNHRDKAKERTEENFQYLAIKFGHYRSSSRKFTCTVICFCWTVSFLSDTDRPLHLHDGLCCDIVHGHSHDLFDFPSDNDGMGKIRGHSKMD